jgi:hypothetical protein
MPVAERQNLFIRKLKLCCVQVDFSDIMVDVKSKEIKRIQLLELVDYINSTKNVFNEQTFPEVRARGIAARNMAQRSPAVCDKGMQARTVRRPTQARSTRRMRWRRVAQPASLSQCPRLARAAGSRRLSQTRASSGQAGTASERTKATSATACSSAGFHPPLAHLSPSAAPLASRPRALGTLRCARLAVACARR